MTNTCEFRTLAWDINKQCEIREKNGNRYMCGRAVEYNSRSVMIYDSFREILLPGLFDESMGDGHDIVCTVDHDMRRICGRTDAQTLKLYSDDKGIGVECLMPDTSYARDAAESIKRKDLPGMSFIMDVRDDEWKTEDGVKTRYISRADIYEVSFVFFPAYPATSAKMRSVPWAIPMDGEKRAIERMNQMINLENLRKRQLWIMEHS
jgi:uncharacterized protein